MATEAEEEGFLAEEGVLTPVGEALFEGLASFPEAKPAVLVGFEVAGGVEKEIPNIEILKL